MNLQNTKSGNFPLTFAHFPPPNILRNSKEILTLKPQKQARLFEETLLLLLRLLLKKRENRRAAEQTKSNFKVLYIKFVR